MTISLAIVGCGGGTASVEVEWEGEEEVATTEVAPTVAPDPTATNVPEPTQDTQDTSEPAAPEPKKRKKAAKKKRCESARNVRFCLLGARSHRE